LAQEGTRVLKRVHTAAQAVLDMEDNGYANRECQCSPGKAGRQSAFVINGMAILDMVQSIFGTWRGDLPDLLAPYWPVSLQKWSSSPTVIRQFFPAADDALGFGSDLS